MLSPPRATALVKSYASCIKFSWLPTTEIGGASKIDGYKIYTNGDFITTVSPQILEHTLDTVTEGNRYSVTISAFSIIGEGAKSLDSLFWAIDALTCSIGS